MTNASNDIVLSCIGCASAWSQRSCNLSRPSLCAAMQDGKTFLDLIAEQVKHMRATYGSKVSVYFLAFAVLLVCCWSAAGFVACMLVHCAWAAHVSERRMFSMLCQAIIREAHLALWHMRIPKEMPPSTLHQVCATACIALAASVNLSSHSSPTTRSRSSS